MILIDIVKAKVRLRIARSSPFGLCVLAIAITVVSAVVLICLTAFMSRLYSYHPKAAASFCIIVLCSLPIVRMSWLVYDALKVKQNQIKRKDDAK